MLSEYIFVDKTKLRQQNIKRYKGVPPSWELIEKVIEKSGLKMMARFEFVYDLPRDTITLYKNGLKGLSAKYWHIFYDFDSVRHKRRRRKKTNQNKPSVLPSSNNLIDAQRKGL